MKTVDGVLGDGGVEGMHKDGVLMGVFERDGVGVFGDVVREGDGREEGDRASVVREGVGEGFWMRVENMGGVSKDVREFEKYLEVFFGVGVRGSVVKVGKDKRGVWRVPEFKAEDMFVVQVKGKGMVEVFEGWYAFPGKSHVGDERILKELVGRWKGKEGSVKWDVEKGDVVYVPRGCAWRSGKVEEEGDSVYLVLALEMEESSVVEGIFAVIDTLPGEDQEDRENPLDEFLAEGGVGSNTTWAEFVKTGVRVAAEVLVPDLRIFYPASSLAEVAIEEAGGQNAEDLLKWKLEQFVTAASEALFDPLMELLASGENEVDTIAWKDTVNWAEAIIRRKKESGSNQEMKKLANMLKYCLAFLNDNADCVDARARHTFNRFFAKERTEEEDTVRFETTIFGAHNQKLALTTMNQSFCHI